MLQVIFTVNAENLSTAEAVLEEFSAIAVTITDAVDEPILEPAPGTAPTWQHNIVTAFFNETIDKPALSSALQNLLESGTVAITAVGDNDWQQDFQQQFSPIDCGNNLWIVPSWCETPDNNAINIKLDPGLAFGTGTHETTFLCLQWLAQQKLHQKTVCDYGCGSGILAIAAKKLGASNVVAVDIDEQALTATQNNAAANDLDDATIITCLPTNMPTTKFDVIIANIVANPLMQLAPMFKELLAPNGKLFISGILDTQQQQVSAKFAEFFEIVAVKQRQEWLGIALQLKN